MTKNDEFNDEKIAAAEGDLFSAAAIFLFRQK